VEQSSPPEWAFTARWGMPAEKAELQVRPHAPIRLRRMTTGGPGSPRSGRQSGPRTKFWWFLLRAASYIDIGKVEAIHFGPDRADETGTTGHLRPQALRRGPLARIPVLRWPNTPARHLLNPVTLNVPSGAGPGRQAAGMDFHALIRFQGMSRQAGGRRSLKVGAPDPSNVLSNGGFNT